MFLFYYPHLNVLIRLGHDLCVELDYRGLYYLTEKKFPLLSAKLVMMGLMNSPSFACMWCLYSLAPFSLVSLVIGAAAINPLESHVFEIRVQQC